MQSENFSTPSEKQALTLLYRDEYYVAIDKPAGLLVHKSDIDKHNTANAMRQLREQLEQWVYPVHRLDRPTSGVLLFALSSEAAAALEKAFSARKVNKTYQAIVRGYVDDQGLIDHPLKPIADFKQDKVRSKNKLPQTAKTRYKSLGKLELPISVDKYPTSRYSLVELYPETGRKHQLRRHLKHIHHPIIGDPKYGKSRHNRFFQDHFNCSRLLLAATQLQFVHPYSQTQITISAELEPRFKKLSTLFSNKS